MPQKQSLVRQIDAVLASHGSWHQQMVIEIKHGKGAFAADSAGENPGCFFADWLESNALDPDVRKTEPYSVVRWLHGECHKLMDQIVGLAREGRKDEAIALLNGQCKGLHGTLERALMSWRAQVSGGKAAALFAA
ncbi:MAG: hypothetical protein KDK10_01195 [Maritimibacter sp.]|nr:hypothetical protein [Maritimibacter sp.]